MGDMQESLNVKVTAIEQLTPLIQRFTLEDINGNLLPEFSGGSHIIVQMKNGAEDFNNAYSLMSQPDNHTHYQICVRLEEDGKGGSKFMHNNVKVDDVLTISAPKNMFELSNSGQKHILIAGGIGITPFIPQLKELSDRNADYELHYAFRAPEHGALTEDLKQSMHADRCFYYINSQDENLNIDELLANQPKQTHIYVCGPQGLIDAVIESGHRNRYRDEYIHWEKFSSDLPTEANAFTLVLAKSGMEIQVESNQTILQALEGSGIEIDCLCRDGYCGTCETNIIEGEAEHFDQYLSDAEKASQQTIMPCVSRAKHDRITLDL